MKLMAAFRSGCDERDSKTTAPVAKEVGETGRLVVLVWPQLRIRKHVDRHEEKSISEPLKCSRQRILAVIRGKSEGAVVPHRSADGNDAEQEQRAGRHNLPLDQLCRDRGEKCDHE